MSGAHAARLRGAFLGRWARVIPNLLVACASVAAGAHADSLDTAAPSDSLQARSKRDRTRLAAGLPAPECTSRSLGGGRIFVRGRAACDAPPAAVYDVVADFDHAAEYVSAMDSSRVMGRDSSTVRVRQIGTTRFIIARTVRMTLRFHPQPPELLRFEIADGDFPVYYGSWRFEPDPLGARVVYDVTMQAPAFIPALLVRPLVERILCRTLREVQAEVRRRQKATRGP
jgi:ribosome-associated toxin RatA of RatAB toxin-antitoxin module